MMKKEEIGTKNTKAEILDALNAALEREKKLSSVKSNPEKEEKERKETKAIEVSKVNVTQNVFSEELIKKFNDLEIAIVAEEEKLKSLYGIEGELNNLTLVVNTGKDCLEKIETDKKTETEKLNSEIKQLEEDFRIKNEELKAQYDTVNKSLKMERDREAEEYSYKTKRERDISNNKWEDEKREREDKLAKIEEETSVMFKKAKDNIEHLESLEKQVNEIPNLLKIEYEKGKKETINDIEKEHKYAVELLTKDFESKINRQEDKIISLKEEIEKANTLNTMLQERLDKAYAQIKELATKTVETAGGVKIISNNQPDNK